MIFASVGSMLPFDRFVRTVDAWAAANPKIQVFIQIGEGSYEPQHAPWTRIMPPADYRDRLTTCDLFVAHVGMGSILQALELRKQMLLLPRRADLKEHTTDHQLHTAARFRDRRGLMIADDGTALQAGMTRLLAQPLEVSDSILSIAPEPMIAAVRGYLTGAAK